MSRIFIFLWLLVANLWAGEKIYANFDVVAKESSQLAMSSFGIVSRINVGIASVVKRGDVLLELENEGEKLALEVAKNDLQRANLALSHAQEVLDRFKQVKSVTSMQNYSDVKFEFDQAVLAKNKATIALKNANKMLNDKILKAPYDGVIYSKNIEVGEGVSGVAQKLIGIFSHPNVKLVIAFDDKFKDKVKVGSEFRYKINSQDNEMVGRIELIHPIIDSKTRKIYAEIYTDTLSVGAFGEGYITAD